MDLLLRLDFRPLMMSRFDVDSPWSSHAHRRHSPPCSMLQVARSRAVAQGPPWASPALGALVENKSLNLKSECKCECNPSSVSAPTELAWLKGCSPSNYFFQTKEENLRICDLTDSGGPIVTRHATYVKLCSPGIWRASPFTIVNPHNKGSEPSTLLVPTLLSSSPMLFENIYHALVT